VCIIVATNREAFPELWLLQAKNSYWEYADYKCPMESDRVKKQDRSKKSKKYL